MIDFHWFISSRVKGRVLGLSLSPAIWPQTGVTLSLNREKIQDSEMERSAQNGDLKTH